MTIIDAKMTHHHPAQVGGVEDPGWEAVLAAGTAVCRGVVGTRAGAARPEIVPQSRRQRLGGIARAAQGGIGKAGRKFGGTQVGAAPQQLCF